MKAFCTIIFLIFNFWCCCQSSIYIKSGATWRTASNLPGEVGDFTIRYGNRKFVSDGYTSFNALGYEHTLLGFNFIDKSWRILSDTELNYDGAIELLLSLISLYQSVCVSFNHGKRSYFSFGPSLSIILIKGFKEMFADNKYNFLIPGLTSSLY